MVSDMCRQLSVTHPSNALSHLPPSPVKHTSSHHLSSCIFFPCTAHLVRVVHVNRGGRVFTTGECSWMEECLPSMYKALGSILSAVKKHIDNWNIAREIMNTLYLKLKFKSICSQKSGFVHVYSCFGTRMINCLVNEGNGGRRCVTYRV